MHIVKHLTSSCHWPSIVLIASLIPLPVATAQNSGPIGATQAQERGFKATTRTSSAGKTYALLIGISRYENDPTPPSLQFADKDAEAFASLLKTPVGGELNEPDEIRILTNEKATRAAIDDAVRNFVVPHAGADNTLILFVAAHGIYMTEEQDPVTRRPIEKDPYILTYDSNTQDPKTTGYPMDEFRRMIAQQASLFARVFVFVDVCHADNVAGIAGGSELEPAVQRLFDGRVGDLGLMLAAQARKYAYESSSFGGGHGAFSYFLISGLNGAAALDGNTSITFEDVFHYVSGKVYDYTDRGQMPREVSTNPDMIVVPDIHRAGLTLGPAEKISARGRRDLSVRTPSMARGVPPPLPASVTDDDFKQAIQRGLLLPEDPRSASSLLAQMRADPNQNSMDLRAREELLHVALADRGQVIMSRYMAGEQIPQTKADFQLCDRYFEEAAALPGDSAFDRSRALFCKGRALIFDSQYDQAEDLLNASIQIDARRAYAYNALGIAELERSARTGSGLDAAVAAFQSAMRFAPYWAYPIHNLALLETERGNYDAAIRLYQDAMKIASRYSYLPYNLGLLYERLGDYENAQRWFEQARVVAESAKVQGGAGDPWPERAQIWNAMGTVAQTLGRKKRAEELFQKALGDDPQNPNARHNLALVFAGRGDFAKADQLWLGNLSLVPKFEPSWIAYTESLAARGDSRGAAIQYEGIVLQKPEYVGAREALARIYVSQKMPALAMAHLDAALKLSPANAALIELRGDAESQLGESGEARTDWSKALDLTSDRAAKKRIRLKLR